MTEGVGVEGLQPFLVDCLVLQAIAVMVVTAVTAVVEASAGEVAAVVVEATEGASEVALAAVSPLDSPDMVRVVRKWFWSQDMTISQAHQFSRVSSFPSIYQVVVLAFCKGSESWPWLILVSLNLNWWGAGD